MGLTENPCAMALFDDGAIRARRTKTIQRRPYALCSAGFLEAPMSKAMARRPERRFENALGRVAVTGWLR
jgi:hypothetical protein